ncbi:MAG: hypothetical protein LBM98_03270 [Oscillospiraceae bacterium]|jgi:hypothetical protein|nr:hypothetical protein [Oscillospiraceae bacterium]
MNVASVNVVSPGNMKNPMYNFAPVEEKPPEPVKPAVAFTPSIPYRAVHRSGAAVRARSATGSLVVPFIVIAAFFAVGAVLGVFSALKAGAGATLLDGLSFQSKPYMRRFVEFAAFPLIAVFLGTTPLGTALIPLLAAVKAFGITFSGIVFLSGVSNGFGGLLLSGGVQALIVTPVFLLLAAENLRVSYGRLRGLKTSDTRGSVRKRIFYALALAILAAAVPLDAYLATFLA